MMLESAFQRRLIKQYEAEGYLVMKVIQCNKPGWPDLQLLKDGRIRFVEVKAKNGRVSPVQQHRHEELRACGFEVEVVTADR